MCLMCLEFAKDRMKIFEVRRALSELVSTPAPSDDKEHYEALNRMSDEEILKTAKKYAEDVENETGSSKD